MAEYLYLDIETIPSQSAGVRAAVARDISPPGSYKKPESIAEWEATQKPAIVDAAMAKTSLDGAYGHLACIGWAIDDGPVTTLSVESVDQEATVLAEWSKAVRVQAGYVRPVIVGHNVAAFDLRFLWQRAFALTVAVPVWLPRDPAPWSDDCHDTMVMWAGRRGYIKLDNLCAAMGVPGKPDGMDGSMVAGMWRDGLHREIASYCKGDVIRTRGVHKIMLAVMGVET